MRTIGHSKQIKLEDGASPRTTRGQTLPVPHRKPLGQVRMFSQYAHSNDAKIAIRAGLIAAGPAGANVIYSWPETDYTASGDADGVHYLWLKIIVSTSLGVIVDKPTIEHFAAADIATATVHGDTYAGRLLCKYTVRSGKVVYIEDLWRRNVMDVTVYLIKLTDTAWYASDSFNLGLTKTTADGVEVLSSTVTFNNQAVT